VNEGGLSHYLEIWNGVQFCSHFLELSSIIAFERNVDPVMVRLITTYATLLLWINLLYFSKAHRSTSFLVECLVTILRDMRPFFAVLIVLILATSVSLIVLMKQSIDPNSTSFDYQGFWRVIHHTHSFYFASSFQFAPSFLLLLLGLIYLFLRCWTTHFVLQRGGPIFHTVTLNRCTLKGIFESTTHTS
jgi:hypothetical protein